MAGFLAAKHRFHGVKDGVQFSGAGVRGCFEAMHPLEESIMPTIDSPVCPEKPFVKMKTILHSKTLFVLIFCAACWFFPSFAILRYLAYIDVIHEYKELGMVGLLN